MTLANLESLVTGAVSHGGGWDPIVIQKVCSQSQDPTNYTTCTSASGWVDLGDLNTFLTWVQNAGQSGGAPAGTTFKTMGAAVASADATAPSTSISCNGAACTSSPYSGVVTVALSAVDLGSGVAKTYYTVDGSTPSAASPVYNGPFTLTGSATVRFYSVDFAGNAEAVHSQSLQIATGAGHHTAHDLDHVQRVHMLRRPVHGAGDGDAERDG